MEYYQMRKSTQVLMSLILLLSLRVVFAGPESDDPARPALGKTGQIFTLKFVQASKRLTVSFVDKPMVTAGPDRIIVVGRQSPKEGEAKSLKISSHENVFEILDTIDPNSPVEIEVRDRSSNKSEKFKFEMPDKP